MKRKLHSFFLIVLVLFLITSCIGVTADIRMNADGSGRIVLEYRVSRIAEAIGRLDGNESWQTVPVGRADFERTVARIEGMRLVSFSSREDNNDIINRVTLDFLDTDALVKFFDPSGRNASITQQNGRNVFHFILNKPVSEINPDLMDLMRQVSAGYKVNISFTSQGNPTLTFTDGEGNATNPPSRAEVNQADRNVSLSMNTAEILELHEGLGLNITW